MKPSLTVTHVVFAEFSFRFLSFDDDEDEDDVDEDRDDESVLGSEPFDYEDKGITSFDNLGARVCSGHF